MPQGRGAPFGLYVHLPYCLHRCSYCDFNAHVRSDPPFDAMAAAILADLDGQIARFPAMAMRPCTSIFFGGGTPSLFPPDRIAFLIQGFAERLKLIPDLEITLETNPATREHGRFQSYRDAGINRMSLGVQSFDEADLRFLERLHDADQAQRAIQEAVAIFPRVSLDLMYGLPGRDLAHWQEQLRQGLATGVGHLSAYQLTVEPQTPMGRGHAAQPLALPDDDLSCDLTETTWALVDRAGLTPYELANFARPGQRCRHNLHVWRYGDYIGLGAGGHGKWGEEGKIWRRANPKSPEGYLADPHQGPWQRVLPEQGLEEALLSGLRTSEGVVRKRVQARTGLSLPLIPETLLGGGWLNERGARIAASREGWMMLDEVVVRWLVHAQEVRSRKG
ncbi:MAG: hypothetical protein AUJ55_05820 [Proteobacteria bacterium CG1_02_64_396]|nr:MAG: hypothetical protein AUJ55_05820 [Proteobacteria bacterium CG1_02_64_396]